MHLVQKYCSSLLKVSIALQWFGLRPLSRSCTLQCQRPPPGSSKKASHRQSAPRQTISSTLTMNAGGLANLLKLAFLVALSTAEKDPRDDQYCFIACQQALSGLTFAGSPSQEETYEGEPCENSLHVQSIFLCVRRYCSEHQVEVGYVYATAGCKASGYPLPSMTIFDSFTMEDMNRIKPLEYGDKPDSVESPVIPSRELDQLGERTQVRHHHSYFSLC